MDAAGVIDRMNLQDVNKYDWGALDAMLRPGKAATMQQQEIKAQPEEKPTCPVSGAGRREKRQRSESIEFIPSEASQWAAGSTPFMQHFSECCSLLFEDDFVKGLPGDASEVIAQHTGSLYAGVSRCRRPGAGAGAATAGQCCHCPPGTVAELAPAWHPSATCSHNAFAERHCPCTGWDSGVAAASPSVRCTQGES